ncbi:MAG TPA: glycosyl hydrolase family 28-related protein [Opitutus sp.]|nr:glycosyl hydrolase family 28-related protein [Opitutus sp.]
MRPLPLLASLFFIASPVAFCADAAAAADPAPQRYSELWGRAGEKWTPTSRLPDFSFAGYRFGEVPLPHVPVAANVRDFGAKGDGEHDDTQAFKAAIAQTSSGAIFIPPGCYVITDILWIRKPNLVLRGAGTDRTILVCPKPLEHIAPNTGATTTGRPTSNYSWSGGIIWVRGSRESRDARAVAADALRGDTVITVASADNLSPGQRVILHLQDDTARTLIDHLYAGDPGDTSKITKPITTSVVSRVVSIDGQRVTLERPLPFDVRAAWTPTLSVFDPDVSEVGIEAIRFEFPITPYEGHFTEPGYNAIAIDRASDCWVRDIHVQNADSGVFLRGTFCTLDGFVLDSDRPLNVARQATGHHALNMGVDCLAQNFDFRTHFIHDITVDSGDVRNVVKNGRGINLSLDHHKRVPYGNLFTNLDAGDGSELWHCGGGAALGKHCAAWGTFWNIRTAKPVPSPDKNFAPPTINLVGLHIDEPTQTDPDGRWFEAIPPGELYPADLHAAQLARRLGRAAKP